MTVPEPMLIGCMPWKVAVSETVVEECTETGARGGGAGPDEVEVEDGTRGRGAEDGGFRYAEDWIEAIFLLGALKLVAIMGWRRWLSHVEV